MTPSARTSGITIPTSAIRHRRVEHDAAGELEFHGEHHHDQHAGDVEEHHLQVPADAARSPVHERARQHQRADLYAGDSGGQHHVRRAENLDVEPVRVMPPAVERHGGDHGEAAPGADESSERRAESEDVDGNSAQGRFGERGGEDQVAAGDAGDDAAELDCEMRGSPESIAADGAMPRDIPLPTNERGGDAERGQPDIPRDRLGSRLSVRSSERPRERRGKRPWPVVVTSVKYLTTSGGRQRSAP